MPTARPRWRIAGPLELVIHAEDGATPGAIVQRYETLALADVYSVIAYYLHHPASRGVFASTRAASG